MPWLASTIRRVTLPRIYLAGPDVFRPDAAAWGRHLRTLCGAQGFEGVFPLDENLPGDLASPQAVARRIYKANIAHIDACDAVLANLNGFRGAEPDSGTCFEVGYAVARGKVVVGHVAVGGTLAERLRQQHPDLAGPSPGQDAQGWAVEDFGLPLNLMLAVPCTVVVGDAAEGLRVLRQRLGAAGRVS